MKLFFKCRRCRREPAGKMGYCRKCLKLLFGIVA